MTKKESDRFYKETLKSGYRILLSLPVLIILVTIFLLSHTAHPEFPKIGIEWQDKIAHVLAYFVLGISLILFYFSNAKKVEMRLIVIFTLLIGSFYGLSDEFHQYFIPGRDAEFLDWIADVFGLSLSLLLIKGLKNKLNRLYVRK